MEMEKCQYCQKEIAPGADDCPNCGGKTPNFEKKMSIRDWNKASIINFGATIVLFAVILQDPPLDGLQGMVTISIYFVLCFGFFIGSINVNAQLNQQLVKDPKDKVVRHEALEKWARDLTQGTFSVLTSIIAVAVYLYLKEYINDVTTRVIPPILLVVIVWIVLFRVRRQFNKKELAIYSWIGFPIFILIYILLDATEFALIV